MNASSIGKALAALRKPKNMKRGDPDHYRKLASLSHAKRKANAAALKRWATPNLNLFSGPELAFLVRIVGRKLIRQRECGLRYRVSVGANEATVEINVSRMERDHIQMLAQSKALSVSQVLRAVHQSQS